MVEKIETILYNFILVTNKLIKFYGIYLILFFFITPLIDAHKDTSTLEMVDYYNVTNEHIPLFKAFRNLGLVFIFIVIILEIIYAVLLNKTHKNTTIIKKQVKSTMYSTIVIILAFAIAGLLLDFSNVAKGLVLLDQGITPNF